MNVKSKLAAAMVFAVSASAAQAMTYNVNAVFNDGGVQQETVFNGSFDWDGSNVTNFSGYLSEAMWQWDSSASEFKMGSGMSEMMVTGQKDYITGIYNDGDAPLLSLTHMVDNSTVNGGSAPSGLHAVSVFLHDDGMGGADTNVVRGAQQGSFPNISFPGGYDVTTDSTYYGQAITGDQTRNWNSFFTLAFDELDPTNTTLAINSISYGDCNALGMMSDTCMSAYDVGGSMNGFVQSLSITAVPVPAAAWLFGGALVSLFGANRRKSVLPA